MKQDHLMTLRRRRTLGSDAAAGEDDAVFELLERGRRRVGWLAVRPTAGVVAGRG